MLWPVNFTLAYVGYEVLRRLSPTASRRVCAIPTRRRRGAAEGNCRRLLRDAAVRRRARHNPVQPYGGMGRGRPHRRRRPRPLAVRPSKTETRFGVTGTPRRVVLQNALQHVRLRRKEASCHEPIRAPKSLSALDAFARSRRRRDRPRRGSRGRSRTDFVREAAVRAAEAALLENVPVRMSEKGFAEFLAAISAPARARRKWSRR